MSRIRNISAAAAARSVGLVGALAFCGLLLAVARQGL
jgi:hypothetical protein